MVQVVVSESPPQERAHQGPSSPATADDAVPIATAAMTPSATINRISHLLICRGPAVDSAREPLFPCRDSHGVRLGVYSVSSPARNPDFFEVQFLLDRVEDGIIDL